MRVDEVERERRVHVVSLMLRIKSTNFIIEYIRKEWRLQKAQAYNYIKAAKEEWEKYFSQVKKCGMSYHVTQLRDLKDQAMEQKKVIGEKPDQKVIEVPNLPLVFEITKEEAKLMGIYPASKIEGNLNLNHSGEIKSVSEYTEMEKNKELERINDKIKDIKKAKKH
jgi:inner membrane protein involved in colicin E2 resistance